VFRCVLGSEGCVLVPRSSGTPVATWAWPTGLVSRRRVLEAVFILLEFSSPSRRIFIGLPFTPPSLVRRISPSLSRSLFTRTFLFHDGILAIKEPVHTNFSFRDGILAIKELFFFTMEFTKCTIWGKTFFIYISQRVFT
jgi:hypothetical protein